MGTTIRPPRVSQGTRRRRRAPAIPRALRQELTQFARSIGRRYPNLFVDRRRKDQLARLLRVLLPPRMRRGRPRDATVTRTITLYRRFRRKFPTEKPRVIWSRIYPIVIPQYGSMPEVEQRTARDKLREQVASRRRKR